MTAYIPIELDQRLDTANLEEQFGRPIPLLGPRRPSIHRPKELISEFAKALQDRGYDPEVDVIVLSGRSIYLTLLMRALKPYEDVKVAMYDAPTCRYYEVTV